ncbi:MAG: Hsp20 family protein [Clostridium sp.]|nr:Hsp20 family protein [Clostridium sp.]
MSNLRPFNRRRRALLSDSNFSNMLDDFFSSGFPTMERNLQMDTFKLDIKDEGENYKVTAELPGIKKEDLDVSLDKGRLKIRVHQEEEKDEEEKNYIHKERRVCSMERNIYLEDADSEDIKARLDDGILNLTIPKKEEIDTSKRIEIE